MFCAGCWKLRAGGFGRQAGTTQLMALFWGGGLLWSTRSSSPVGHSRYGCDCPLPCTQAVSGGPPGGPVPGLWVPQVGLGSSPVLFPGSHFQGVDLTSLFWDQEDGAPRVWVPLPVQPSLLSRLWGGAILKGSWPFVSHFLGLEKPNFPILSLILPASCGIFKENKKLGEEKDLCLQGTDSRPSCCVRPWPGWFSRAAG